jgi:hypothetical protein
VATWLAVLVPMVARRRQQTPRPSDAALSCRVLERPRQQHRRNQEVTAMDDATDSRMRAGAEAADPSDQRARDQPPSGAATRYRPGRGGYDPEAAALAAQARYAFRQRMVLVLVLFAGISAVLAATLRMTNLWYLHAGIDLTLIGYLVYLRRQVRLEQSIRARRAARGTGRGRGSRVDGGSAEPGWSAEDGRAGGTGWAGSAERGRAGAAGRKPTTVAEAVAARDAARRAASAPGDAWGRQGRDAAGRASGASAHAAETADDDSWETGAEPADDESEDIDYSQPALPRLRPTPLPTPPPGATRLELDDEHPDLHDLAEPQPRGYRRAAGQ